MKAKIGILSEELARKCMIRIAEGKVTSEEPYPQFLFESLAVLSQLLSNENVELLNLIAREKPNSLDELAEMSGRSIKDVTDTFEALSSKGFAYLDMRGSESRPIALFTTFEIVMGSYLLLESSDRT
ncbi:transcriptional regulator [Vibrio parahaemolyticus]|uniref:HVO_A0114 family putative DNA-binding protein n=1 Tax=Vibrio TaxID=662 RepID=UPI0009935907|nr:transcriptional regulator [Vibrio parahaemolyticus]EGR1578395.1 transcriptional regulator [Vibrio parahaemolyticus]OOQ68970.1 transcriptional regulator [Vibrio parahaemolyticus]PMT75641.1 transcriptional regulator [Vibrio parahaemolyticus]PMT81070.1 transcriptional regulator [Vibrio parahaemolyticus]HCE2405302.1 transcriptional regulator [Vibrio parahaemolyticus]